MHPARHRRSLLQFAYVSERRWQSECAVTQSSILDQTTAASHLAAVRESIAAAAREAGRNPDDVTLVAVSKTFDAEHIRPVLAAGQRVFGENRVQEAKAKWPDLKTDFPDVELHLIGPLQSNKSRDAVELFDCIHTLDRPKTRPHAGSGNAAPVARP